MKRMLLAVVVLLSVAATTPLGAQSFGNLFPVTNTRYRSAFGVPRLTSNSTDFFLFWGSTRRIRATRLIDGEPRSGHVVLNASGGFDVAWTGERFMVVATADLEQRIIGRFLDEAAEPRSPEVTIVEHGVSPRIAAGPDAMLLIYADIAGNIRSLPLAANGESIGATARLLAPPSATAYAVAANANGFVATITTSEDIRAIAFDTHGNVVGDRTLTHGDRYYRDVTVATDGTKYVVVWTEETAVLSATIDADGNFGAPLVVDAGHRFPRNANVIWNGAGWTVTFDANSAPDTGDDRRTTIAQLDFAAQRVASTEQTGEGLGYSSVAALDGRVLAAWAPLNGQPGGISVTDLPLAANEARAATFNAAQQTLKAATSSNNATLMIWAETGDGTISLRAGLRTVEGRWSEREIADDVDNVQIVLAASDGREFAVTYFESGQTKLVRLDEDGQILSRTTLPIIPVAMTWNGSQYAMIDVFLAKGMLLAPTGTLSPAMSLPDLPYRADAVASDGHGGLLVVGQDSNCQFELCLPLGVYATRLNANFERVGNDITLTDDDAQLAGVAWNGFEYVTAWSGTRNGIARIPASPAQSISISTITAPVNPQGITALTNGSIALVGHKPELNGTLPTIRVAILHTNGTPANVTDVEFAESVGGIPRLVALPNSGLGYLASSIQQEAPHHGTYHVMMAIARPSIALPPGAPYVRAKLADGRIEVDWAPPAGTFNGYRIEYRVDDGAWNELEQWFPASATHTSIAQPSFGTNFAIRIRAFNDGGAGAYSTPASTKPGRRRAVR